MRKTKIAVCAGLMALGGAAQATVTITNGGTVTGTADGGDCAFMANQVTLNTSKGVNAAFDCRVADAVVGTVNRVIVGACHIGGTAKARTVACTSDGGTGFTPAGCADATSSVQVSGVALFSSSTAGGAIAEDGMGTATCVDGSGVTSLINAMTN